MRQLTPQQLSACQEGVLLGHTGFAASSFQPFGGEAFAAAVGARSMFSVSSALSTSAVGMMPATKVLVPTPVKNTRKRTPASPSAASPQSAGATSDSAIVPSADEDDVLVLRVSSKQKAATAVNDAWRKLQDAVQASSTCQSKLSDKDRVGSQHYVDLLVARSSLAEQLCKKGVTLRSYASFIESLENELPVTNCEQFIPVDELERMSKALGQCTNLESMMKQEQEIIIHAQNIVHVATSIRRTIDEVKKVVQEHEKKVLKEAKEKKKQEEQEKRRWKKHETAIQATADEELAAHSTPKPGRGGCGKGRGRGRSRGTGIRWSASDETVKPVSAMIDEMENAVCFDSPTEFSAAVQAGTVDFNKPYVVLKADAVQTALEGDKAVLASLDIFGQQFAATRSGRSSGRCSVPFTRDVPDVVAQLQKLAPPLTSQFALADDAHVYAKKMKTLAMYGVTENAPPYYGTEVLQLASLRLNIQGARSLCVVPYCDLMQAINDKLSVEELNALPKQDIARASVTLRTLGAYPQVAAMLKNSMYVLRHNKMSLAYIPMAYFTVEMLGSSGSDCGDAQTRSADADRHVLGVRLSVALTESSPAIAESLKALTSLAEKDNMEEGKLASFMKLICEKAMVPAIV